MTQPLEFSTKAIFDVDDFGEVVGIEVDGFHSSFPSVQDGWMVGTIRVAVDVEADIAYLHFGAGTSRNQRKGSVTLIFDAFGNLAAVEASLED